MGYSNGRTTGRRSVVASRTISRTIDGVLRSLWLRQSFMVLNSPTR